MKTGNNALEASTRKETDAHIRKNGSEAKPCYAVSLQRTPELHWRLDGHRRSCQGQDARGLQGQGPRHPATLPRKGEDLCSRIASQPRAVAFNRTARRLHLHTPLVYFDAAPVRSAPHAVALHASLCRFWRKESGLFWVDVRLTSGNFSNAWESCTPLPQLKVGLP